jgi:RimJ/RimL family protein N-acetyltransferase
MKNKTYSGLSGMRVIEGVPAMADAARYSVIELFRDGRRVEIRAVRSGDWDGLAKAVDRASADTLRRRFFAVRRHFSEREIAFFSDVDFVSHVALVAVVEEGGRPVIAGGGRYIVVQPGLAEIAFALLDEYQGQGLGTVLMRHLTAIAREAGLHELIAEVLAENTPMLKVFEKSGLRLTRKRERDVVHIRLQLS